MANIKQQIIQKLLYLNLGRTSCGDELEIGSQSHGLFLTEI